MTGTLKNGMALPLNTVPILEYEVFQDALKKDLAAQGRVAAYFGRAAGEEVELFALIAHDWKGELQLLRSRVGKRFPSLTPEIPQLHLFERRNNFV